MKTCGATLIAAVMLASCGGGGGGGSSPPPVDSPGSGMPGEPAPPPEPAAPITVITGVTFDESTHQRLAEGSDNWPLTWSDDDHQYAIWGDGGGFGGSDSEARASFGVARIEGDSQSYRGMNRYGGKDGECVSR